MRRMGGLEQNDEQRVARGATAASGASGGIRWKPLERHECSSTDDGRMIEMDGH